MAQAEDMCIIGKLFCFSDLIEGCTNLTISWYNFKPCNLLIIRDKVMAHYLCYFIVLGWECVFFGRLFEIGFHVGQVDNSLSSFRWVTIVHVVICACGAIGKEFLLSTSRYTKCFMCVV